MRLPDTCLFHLHNSVKCTAADAAVPLVVNPLGVGVCICVCVTRNDFKLSIAFAIIHLCVRACIRVPRVRVPLFLGPCICL